MNAKIGKQKIINSLVDENGNNLRVWDEDITVLVNFPTKAGKGSAVDINRTKKKYVTVYQMRI